MRAVIQRVSQASVTVGARITGRIGSGLMVLLAVEEGDTEADIQWLSGKIIKLRVFDDADGVMNRSVQDVVGGILLISQFTLYASTRKGNRPSYLRSAPPTAAGRKQADREHGQSEEAKGGRLGGHVVCFGYHGLRSGRVRKASTQVG